jgi:hypothetical protein
MGPAVLTSSVRLADHFTIFQLLLIVMLSDLIAQGHAGTIVVRLRQEVAEIFSRTLTDKQGDPSPCLSFYYEKYINYRFF